MYLDKTTLPQSNTVDEPNDIFDSLGIIYGEVQQGFSIYFPYNVAGNHWVSIGIDIVINSKQASVAMQYHDPYVASKDMPQDIRNSICTSLEKRMLAIHLVESVKYVSTSNRAFKSPRQATTNTQSCGLFVAEEIPAMMTGAQLQDGIYTDFTMRDTYQEHKLIDPSVPIPKAYQSAEDEELAAALAMSMGM